MASSPDDLPSGLVFSSLRPSSSRRGPVLVVVALTILSTLALTAPGYALVPAVEPYVLGLPFSFAWVVGWMAVLFGGLLGLYWAEPSSSD
jgi:hypothetical protein